MKPDTSKRIVPRDPSTGEELGRLPVFSPEEIRKAVAIAREVQKTWRETQIRERIALVRNAMHLIAESADKLHRQLVRETGKPVTEALLGEIGNGLLVMDYYVRHGERILQPKRLRSAKFLWTTTHWETYSPVGVAGVISPWNFPFYLTLCPTIPALIAGNCVINKPSEFTPLTALHIKEILDQAGFPEGVFQVVTGYGAAGAALIDAGVNMVSFTGSVATGRKVAEACGRRLIPCNLELGGKDAALVLEDADLERAANGVVWGALCHSGQICASIERVYVVEPVAERFSEMVVERVRKLVQGPTLDPDTEIGAINNEQQLRKIEDQVAEALKGGARAETGGKWNGAFPEGHFFEPTVLVGVKDDDRVMAEETFGPVIPIRVVKDENEAVKLANRGPYGLCASVWTRNEERALRLVSQLEAGNIFVNDHITPTGNPAAPWGGIKDSGVGRAKGEHGLLGCVHIRHVSVERLNLKSSPMWYPYTPAKASFFLQGLSAFWGRTLRTRLKALLALLPRIPELFRLL
ncbi:MAG: aldehyde dehydrogenase family protein [Armatimonadetes bacterium]|nr:aldehyde dehydrogenase family protein [Armatimonadota bacterium]